MPLLPSTLTRSPLRRRIVALPHPTTAGMPSSRATIAAWDRGAPTSVTTPEPELGHPGDRIQRARTGRPAPEGDHASGSPQLLVLDQAIRDAQVAGEMREFDIPVMTGLLLLCGHPHHGDGDTGRPRRGPGHLRPRLGHHLRPRHPAPRQLTPGAPRRGRAAAGFDTAALGCQTEAHVRKTRWPRSSLTKGLPTAPSRAGDRGHGAAGPWTPAAGYVAQWRQVRLCAKRSTCRSSGDGMRPSVLLTCIFAGTCTAISERRRRWSGQ